MAREPHYPDDDPVGSGASEGKSGTSASPRVGEAAAAAASAKSVGGRRNKQLITGAAIGIGSAAIVAALLYANRRTRNERGGNG